VQLRFGFVSKKNDGNKKKKNQKASIQGNFVNITSLSKDFQKKEGERCSKEQIANFLLSVAMEPVVGGGQSDSTTAPMRKSLQKKKKKKK